MELNKIYFHTAMILHRYPLLKENVLKQYIIDGLQHFCQRQRLIVYAFAIMPDRLLIIWKMLVLNGKEMPNVGLMKYTGRKFQEHLRTFYPGALPKFLVEYPCRTHRFWQEDPLPIELYSPHLFWQKLDFIHDSPLQEHWRLAQSQEEYFYSSARFYTSGKDDFGFLTRYKDEV